MAATGSVTSKAPSLVDIRRGSYGAGGWNEESQKYGAQRRASQTDEDGNWLQRRTSNQSNSDRPKGMHRGSSDRLKTMGVEPFPALTEEELTAQPTQGNRAEEGVSQAPSYNDAHTPALKQGHVKEDAVGNEKNRPPSLDRQVRLSPC